MVKRQFCIHLESDFSKKMQKLHSTYVLAIVTIYCTLHKKESFEERNLMDKKQASQLYITYMYF